jgi:Phosphotransferase enzyme family
VGSTIRKPAGPWTPTTHALLRHLRANGFDLAPEPLGVDERDREVLAWVEGEAAFRPWPSVLGTDDGVIELAKALRRYHELARTFDPGPDAVWRAGPRAVGPSEIVCHGDFAPWNTVWTSGRLVGVIDWDMAEPGHPSMDVAFLALHLVPLRPDETSAEVGEDDSPPRRHRLDLLCDAYGELDPREVIDAVFEHHLRDRERTITWGGAGREPWVRFLQDGMLDVIDRDEAWLREYRHMLR